MADNNTTINTDNVTTGGPVEGACCYTDFSANPTLPTSATDSLVGTGSTFENVGELSDQGWTISTSTTVNKFKGYHGLTLLSEIADEEVTVKVELAEVCRPTVAKLRYGEANVTVVAGMVTAITPTIMPGQIVPLVFDTLFSNGIVERTVFPRAKIESIDDEARQKGALRVHGMTFTALVDDNGHPYYVYRARLAATADTSLTALTVGTLQLTPAFTSGATTFAASTTSSTVNVTAIPADAEATVEVKCGSTTVTNGGSASLSAGENTITVTVTKGTASTTYTVVVTKS